MAQLIFQSRMALGDFIFWLTLMTFTNDNLLFLLFSCRAPVIRQCRRIRPTRSGHPVRKSPLRRRMNVPGTCNKKSRRS